VVGFKLPIDKVGIINVRKKVDIIQENKKYSFYPHISALISLPAEQRGIRRRDQILTKTIRRSHR
jgi:GTP cyclohydrolase FolE2